MTLIDETTGQSFVLACQFTERQKEILLAGGLLKYVAKEAQ